ncbi:MAG: uroporphyrinogen decarboxylase family protein [Candidatus Bathyarchaeia archaeon]
MRERFLAALEGEKPDRPPLAHVAALTTVELQEMTNCYMPEVHNEPEKLVKLLAANNEVLGFDAVTFIINYFNEPAALGCEMRWGNKEQLPVVVSHPWSRSEDAFVPEDLLDGNPIQVYLKALRIAKEEYGSKIAVLGKVMGPFSMVLVMHGFRNTMIGMIKEPDKIQHFINIATDILIKCANAQFDERIDALAIGEGGAGGHVMSPKMHERFLFENHRRMIKSIHGPTIMHICGDITPRLHLLSKIGLVCFNFDWDIKPKVMKELSKGKFKIMGNVDTTDLLTAKPEVVERQVIENLEAGVDIISPGCAISPKCPNSNLKAMSEAIKKWKNKE